MLVPTQVDMSMRPENDGERRSDKLILQNNLVLNSVFNGIIPCNFGRVYLSFTFLWLFNASAMVLGEMLLRV